MTVTCDSNGYYVDTDCPDCAVLIEKTKGQAALIAQLDKDIRALAARVKRQEAAGAK